MSVFFSSGTNHLTQQMCENKLVIMYVYIHHELQSLINVYIALMMQLVKVGLILIS